MASKPRSKQTAAFKCDIELADDNAYIPGTIIKGNVVLEAQKEERIDKIDISFSAEVRTRWSISSDSRNDFLDVEIPFNDKLLHLLGEARDEDNSHVMMAGVHNFPFQFQLPVDGCPSSWRSGPGAAADGSIRYWLTASVTYERYQLETIRIQRDITVNEVVDINIPRLIAPLSNSSSKGVCCGSCASGPISLSVTTDRGGYCIGETIGVSVDAKNYSSRRVTAVRASLKQKGTLYAKQNGNRVRQPSERNTEVTIESIEGPGIAPGGTCTWINEPLHIPVTATPTVTSCRIIKVSYSVVVKLALRYTSDLHVTIPITLGSVPYNPLGMNSDTATAM